MLCIYNFTKAVRELVVMAKGNFERIGMPGSLDEINAVGHKIAWWRKVYFICNSNGNGGLFKAICVFFWCR